ncbi:MAG: hypothetical protein JWQ30_2002 [Sediminibacterium sp.]|nr:hypothetical protein [Sediminibacterium sp.]
MLQTIQKAVRGGIADVAVHRMRRKALKKFLYYFRKGYRDKKYEAWERDYKWQAHLLWEQQLNTRLYQQLLSDKRYSEIAHTAVRIESKTNLLFSFEKMALRDAVKTEAGARAFAVGLYNYVYGEQRLEERFIAFTKVLEALPRKQTRVVTWPLHTVFGFIANPMEHIFLKPKVTQAAAKKYGFEFDYRSGPNWQTYESLLAFAETVRADTRDYQPKDYIDLQSFIWVQGSEEYPD